MIYNNGTITVHKSHADNLIFAVTKSGLVKDGMEAKVCFIKRKMKCFWI